MAEIERLATFQEELAEVVARVQRVDLRRFEMLDAESALLELRPIAQRLLGDAQELVSSILSRCEELRAGQQGGANLHDPFLGFERALDAAVESVESSGGSVQSVEDVAFLVQLELRQRAERLARIGAGATVLVVIGEHDSVLRRIHKGLGAIDCAIAKAAAIAPRLDFSSQLSDSLLVRDCYAKFRARVLSDGTTPAPSELYARMRAAGTSIAVLVGWSAYPLLRVRDRLQLRELQQRILAWLRPERRDDHTAGLRLWQDLIAFVDMLNQVSRRQELVEHDAALVRELLARLRGATGPVDEATLGAARRLHGLDDALDLALFGEGPLDARALEALLTHVAARLGVAPAGER
jgi:hypothetical protein